MPRSIQILHVTDQTIEVDGDTYTSRQVVIQLDPDAVAAAVTEAATRAALPASPVVQDTAMRALGLDLLVKRLAGIE